MEQLKTKLQTLFFLIIVLLFNCTSDSNIIKENSDIIGKSIYYNEAIFNISGDFSGFILGQDNLKTSQKRIPKEFQVESEEDYLFYDIDKLYTKSEYQLIFQNNKLTEIYFDTELKNEKGEEDINASIILFNELKSDFIKKFGGKYLENEKDQPKIFFWNKENKNIQLILDKAKVHAYLDLTSL